MDRRRFEFPVDRHYDRDHHLWICRRGEVVRLGIDAIGLDSLGELAYVALEPVGKEFGRGEAIGSLEAAKMTTSIAAPISGTLLARNEQVLRDPLLVNRDPYESGWIVEIAPSSWEAESRALVSGDAIPAWVEAETRRWSGA